MDELGPAGDNWDCICDVGAEAGSQTAWIFQHQHHLGYAHTSQEALQHRMLPGKAHGIAQMENFSSTLRRLKNPSRPVCITLGFIEVMGLLTISEPFNLCFFVFAQALLKHWIWHILSIKKTCSNEACDMPVTLIPHDVFHREVYGNTNLGTSGSHSHATRETEALLLL